MVEFDLNNAEHELLRSYAAVIDGRSWLESLRRRMGMRMVSRKGDADWPSFELDFRLASRYFSVEIVDGYQSLVAKAQTGTRQKIINDPLAWFALVPWELSRVSTRFDKFLRLEAPELIIGENKTKRWSFDLPYHYRIEGALMSIDRFAVSSPDGRFILGWSAIYL